MKLSRRETLEAGLLDAPLTVVKNVEQYESFAIELVHDTGTSGSAALHASCDYDPEDESGSWSLVEGSTQALDFTNGGIHIWNVTEFISPYLKIVITGDVESVEIYFIGQPNQARLAIG